MKRLSLWYGLAVGSLGMLPFVAPVLEQAGFEDSSITLLLLALPVGHVVFGPLGAGLADRTGRHHRFLRTVLWLSALLVVGMTVLPPWGLAVCFVVFGALRAPLFPVADAATLHRLGSRYGQVRAVGSVVYALVVLGVGAGRGLWPEAPLWVGAALLGGAGLFIEAVPEIPQQERPRLVDLWGRLSRGATGMVLLVALLNGLSLAIYDHLFTLYMDTRGVSAWVSAAAVAWGVTVEVVVLFAGPWLLARFDVRTLMIVGTGMGIPRFLGTAWIADPHLVAALQGLHGLQFGLFWVAGLDWMSRVAPPDLRRSFQASFSATGFGLAPILALGLASMWLVSADLTRLFEVLAFPAVLATLCAAWIPKAPLR